MGFWGLFKKKSCVKKVISNQIIVKRDNIEGLIGFNEIEETLQSLVAISINKQIFNLIDLSIDGYGLDKRELHEIPEVCEWARVLRQKIPLLFYFLDLSSAKRYVGWLCGPVSVDEILTNKLQIRYQKELNKCIDESWKQGNDYLIETGASKDFIESLQDADFSRISELSIMATKIYVP